MIKTRVCGLYDGGRKFDERLLVRTRTSRLDERLLVRTHTSRNLMRDYKTQLDPRSVISSQRPPLKSGTPKDRDEVKSREV